MSRAVDLAQYLVRGSTLHPAFRSSSMLYDMDMGGYPDPTTQVQPPSADHRSCMLRVASTHTFCLCGQHSLCVVECRSQR